ncbi:hypothetical protein GKF99_04155 [Finegoldia sp. BIOML-A2]|uniref:hypothetical protein n=1 Tax=unclassified Finegoldia TaxID=2619637 RepID=UPI0012AF390D|nr:MULTISPECIES: hypothetical protein [unclassified Finegoldia]MDU5923357.1 hypothetical protein [Finegoldia magna]MSA97282.1 hypothetical protein [Finegoldia sp. BIOML-A5]MSB00608.1 hypothetical protein [Finegoldia sp. BIOML-A2]
MSEFRFYELTRNYVSAIGFFLIASVINLIFMTKNNNKKSILNLIVLSVAMIYASIMMNITITILRDGTFEGNEFLSNLLLIGTFLLMIITLISIILSIYLKYKK